LLFEKYVSISLSFSPFLLFFSLFSIFYSFLVGAQRVESNEAFIEHGMTLVAAALT